jgi:preprotein translocase subunit YajC
LFQTLSPGIFFFSNIRKKKTQRKKNHIEEKKCKEGRELTFKLPLYPLIFGSWLCLLVSAFLFQTFSFSIFFFSNKRKRKKKHREEKKCRKGKELTFKLSLWLLIFGSCFCPPTFALSFQTFFPFSWHLLLLK